MHCTTVAFGIVSSGHIMYQPAWMIIQRIFIFSIIAQHRTQKAYCRLQSIKFKWNHNTKQEFLFTSLFAIFFSGDFPTKSTVAKKSSERSNIYLRFTFETINYTYYSNMTYIFVIHSFSFFIYFLIRLFAKQNFLHLETSWVLIFT